MGKFKTPVFKRIWIKGAAGLAVMLTVFCMMTFSSLAAQGKVKNNTNIRAQASTDSEVVGSAMAGKTIDILEAVKDSAGTVWYKVSVANGGYGYIRSDLVETSETIAVSTTATSTQLASNTSTPADTQPTTIEQQQATVNSSKSNSVNIRSGASTQHSIVTSLPNGTEITLIGEANDSSGKKWYQLTCNYNDKTIEGYVRSDLIASGGAPAEGASEGGGENPEGEGGEGENPEGGEGEGEGGEEGGGEQPTESAPEEEHNDYDIAYMLNESTGEYEYYFLNYTDGPTGTKTRVTDILNLINGTNDNTAKMEEQVKNEKIVIIILAVVIVVLFIILTILLFKIRDLSYDDYEDEDDEEEEEEEPVPVRKKVRRRVVDDEEEEEPALARKKKSTAPPAAMERSPKSREKTGQGKTKGEKELYAAERKEPARKPAARKAQNFLVDDDEFEFEFLNMDDKDL